MESRLMQWIDGERDNKHRVSRNMIKNKALEFYEEMADGNDIRFVASTGWLENFLTRFNLCLRRKTAQSQRLPESLVTKLVLYIVHLRQLKSLHNYPSMNIHIMDETACWFDCISNTTIEHVRSKSVQLKTTGHEKQRHTVVLSARGDGSKEKPCLIFKDKGKRVDPALKIIIGINVMFSDNGWMNASLTLEWLRLNVHKSLFNYNERSQVRST
jgi:hypothetical protein